MTHLSGTSVFHAKSIYDGIKQDMKKFLKLSHVNKNLHLGVSDNALIYYLFIFIIYIQIRTNYIYAQI